MSQAAVLPSLTPSRDAGRTRLPAPRRLRRGFEAWLHGFVGCWRSRPEIAREWLAQADEILLRVGELRERSDERLDEELASLRTAFQRAAPDAPVPLQAGFAVVAETARRTLGLDPHREQIAGAWGLWHGNLVEMATGEGKTLTLGLVAVLCGWQRRPCHVVTANDYLAARDAKTLKQFHTRCGVTVGHVIGELPPAERREGYAADVTYTTAKELVADFLRDRLQYGLMHSGLRRAVRSLGRGQAHGVGGVVMRGLHTVLVDEADHVLIDEAVTPLIISRARPNQLLADACVEAMDFASGLQPQSDYVLDRSVQAVELTPDARQRVCEQWTPSARVFRNRRWRVELITQALKAREFFQRDKHYVIRDGKVVIVDEGTGRPQAQRSWRQGLHQLIEAKEGLRMSEPAETLASVSFQRFFRQVPRLAGVTGTARENARELWRVYGLAVVALPTHRPCQRTTEPVQVSASSEERWAQVLDAIVRIHGMGQPVLVGTRSVSASEHVAALLAGSGITCAVLNARQLEHEAAIIAQAGQRGRVTIATNLAGRGTDIRLGDGIAALGGLCVIATERHAAGRIDRQLHGRAARQGDPGRVLAFASLEDELATRYLPTWYVRLLRRLTHTDSAATRWLTRSALGWAQRGAERQALNQRLGVLQRDGWLEENLGG